MCDTAAHDCMRQKERKQRTVQTRHAAALPERHAGKTRKKGPLRNVLWLAHLHALHDQQPHVQTNITHIRITYKICWEL
eukprot:406019-Pelagomonas_calceolata.AAC.1